MKQSGNTIVSFATLEEVCDRIHKRGLTIVVAGGCFDLLHDGHVQFLRKAKKQGDVLIVLLESDESVSKMKGKLRPFQTQQLRAQNLANISVVDYVVPLPFFSRDEEYDKLISLIKPAIIATTIGDPGRHHKERQAEHYGVTVIDVIARIPDMSTTKLAQHTKNTK